jgi:integrase
MRVKSPFTLFHRKFPSGIAVWYYITYDENGQRRQFSTGCLKKSQARRFCLDLFRTDRLLNNKTPLFRDYTADWFDYDKCSYVQSRLLHGFTYSRSYADGQRSTLTKLIWPFFGKFPLEKINVTLIEKWLSKLKADGYANISINHNLSTLKIILNEAYRRGDITVNPAPSVRALADDCKTKGIFTQEEAAKLLDSSTIQTVWEGNQMHYTINLVAAQTGMRLGEVQALLKTSIFPDHIEVCHAWDRIYGLKGTKTNKPRQVPIAKDLYDRLQTLAKAQTEGDYVFSMSNGIAPVDHSIVYKWFRRALDHIGIDDKARKERNLSFHSWRHYVNTELRTGGVPDSVVQAITGHADKEMTEHYTHVQLEDMGEARKILTSTTNKQGAAV